MTFTDAAAEVLRLIGRPLHYKEITDFAIERNLLSHVGKSPEVTMGARLAALMEMHDQLRDEFVDFQEFCDVFPRFIEKLVDRFGSAEVTCFEQAQVMANSANKLHRDAAGEWLARHYARGAR